MYISIRHITIFNYTQPISESVMELRMQPRTEGAQRCLSFKATVNPYAAVLAYRDYEGNIIHHFDLPARHQSLTVTAEAFVETSMPLIVPYALQTSAWDELDTHVAHGDYYAWLQDSQFVQPTAALYELAHTLNAQARRSDPLTFLRELNVSMYHAFEYQPNSTKVDSPIDDALKTRKGVCQDFTHIFMALGRRLGIPCRYVSGYLARYTQDKARSVPDASHAWLEAYLPNLGWVGFDPTNNRLADEHHVRVAIGRDYADVPPTRGVFKGTAASELKVAVQVRQTEALPPSDEMMPITNWIVYGTDEEQVQAAQHYAAQQYAIQQQQQQ
jgi:transglutaminase-like putative cysteine protease